MKLFFSILFLFQNVFAQDLVFTFNKKAVSVEIIEKYMKEHAPEITFSFIQKDDPCAKLDYTKILLHVCFIDEQMKFNHLNTTDLPKKYALLFEKEFEELNNEYK